MAQKKTKLELLKSISQRAHYLSNQMIYLANHRQDQEKGDPKVGGHPAASTSSLHILGALHLVVKSGFDHISNKPHASPTDHAYNYLLDLHLNKDLSRLSLEESNRAMHGLRAFPQDSGEKVFQSYHSAHDPDHHNLLPSGSVGIPPVKVGYLALAYRYAKEHGYDVPEAHFWSIVGDSEFREGSLFEAIPDFAERELGQLTWIIDYNRQSLDGHRMTNKEIMGGTDAHRIQRTAEANGWQVIQVQHGKKRQKLIASSYGKDFQKWIEEGLSDYCLQVLLQIKDGTALRKELLKNHSQLKNFLNQLTDEQVYDAIHDLGGHDFEVLIEAMESSKKDPRRPTIIIAHTLKGWGLKMAATPGNHSVLPDAKEIAKLKSAAGSIEEEPFVRFDPSTAEGQFLRKRGQGLYQQIVQQHELREKNKTLFLNQLEANGGVPESMEVNLKMANYPHTQWMLGQLTAKLTRIANTTLDESQLKEKKKKPLNKTEKAFKQAGEMMVAMAPDVGTSTNLNPVLDGHVFGAKVEDDYETEVGVKDHKAYDLIPEEQLSNRYLRFEIAEGNTMSCMGAYGRLRDTLGIPLLPLMTVYDFFIKRALDQYFYNLYWQSSFILCGTPSGVTLSPEGAQHGWKSDLQIPNQITWEPYFCQEMDWIFCESLRRHLTDDNQGRTGVVIRGVTRGVEQKDFLKLLKTQHRFKSNVSSDTILSPAGIKTPGTLPADQVENLSDAEILAIVRKEILAGAYYLLNYRGYASYEPGDNVINIFSMGAVTKEAVIASQQLLEKGIYANIIVVTSPDLLIGNLGHENNYYHLREGLGINSNLHLVPYVNGATEHGDLATLSGRRVPIVSVHDGEPGLLDNLGSIVGVKQEALAVRKHSLCGRPKDVYNYHSIDEHAIFEACGKILSETALEQVEISRRVLHETAATTGSAFGHWRELWPTTKEN